MRIVKKLAELINDFLNDNKELQDKKITDLLVEFRKKTGIEEYKEEDFVLRELVRGTPMKHICEKLNQKHPEHNFSITEFKTFLDRNKEIVKSLENSMTNVSRRHLAARTQVEEEMADLYLFTKELLKKFNNEGDNNATLGAIKALNLTLVNYCKLVGMGGFNNSGVTTNIEVNVGEKREAKTLEANFKMVDTEEITKDEE